MHPPLGDLQVVDVLEADPRPSFIVDLAGALQLVYCNPALSAKSALLDTVTSPNEEHAKLWAWIGNTAASTSPSLAYANAVWTRIVVKEKWAIVSANSQPIFDLRDDDEPELDIHDESPLSRVADRGTTAGSDDIGLVIANGNGNGDFSAPEATQPPSTLQAGLPPPLDRRAKSTSGLLSAAAKSTTTTTQTPAPASEPLQALRRSTTEPAWILPDILYGQRPFLEVIHAVDWALTPLGPMNAWHPRLQQTFNQILADSRPIAIYWGEQYSTVYNEAFSKLCGSKHPALLGKPVEAAWPDVGEKLKETMLATGTGRQRSGVEDEWGFFVEKEPESPGGASWPEETYLKWSLIPIMEGGGECLGFTHPVLETTSMRLWERRMKMLIELGEVLVTARDVKSYWSKTIEELAAVEPRYDIPLAILYSVIEDPDPTQEGGTKYESTKLCQLEGSLGVPDGHPIMPHTLALGKSDEGLSVMFREALKFQSPLLLQTKDGTLPEALLSGLQWRGFGDPCRAAVVCPLRPTREENVMGLLFLGLNPRRSYDNDYRQYISLLNQKLTTSLASTVLLEEEARRVRNAAEQAAYDNADLQEQLAVQMKEATESIQKFEAVAEFIPVGMCFGDDQGNITFANDAWYRITGYPSNGSQRPGGWLSCVKDEDRHNVVQAYEDLQSQRNVTFEFRVTNHLLSDRSPPLTRDSPSLEKTGLDLGIEFEPERHVLASAKAERAPDGSIIRVLTCLTDVTLHKKTAEEAVRRAQQAENLKRMAEFATVGMYDMDLRGRLMGANNVFFEMCGLEKVDLAEVIVRPWETAVYKEDYPLLKDKLDRMVSEDKVQTAEIRLKTPRIVEDGDGRQISTSRWIQATLMPVRSSDGVIQSFTGCLTDVSLQKWQLEREKQRKEEAIESKRQQETFIDMTSHEMRNPLGAILHCADAVIATLTRVQELIPTELAGQPNHDGTALTSTEADAGPQVATAKDPNAEERNLLDASIENAETIVACAQHQKRIVDDILTMSKLDSKLLAVTPITVDPIVIVQDALKMFEVEARRVDIDLNMIIDQSYRDLTIEFLDFDPSRLKQVLINLLTNALKFTKTGPTRSVSVTISASRSPPDHGKSSVDFIPRSKGDLEVDYEQPVMVDHGEPVYLLFEVKDTGQGLTEEEMKSLFQRFVQASSRTHVKYGGSGLGLFISRRLTELQNGAIGVSSLPGVGSTFAFYIEAYQPSEEAVRAAAAAAKQAQLLTAATGLQLGFSRVAGGRASGVSSTGVTTPTTPTMKSHEQPSLAGLPPPPQITHVLVVEDNLINQQITRRGLTDRGYIVDVANHGVEALEKLKATERYIEAEADKAPAAVNGSAAGPGDGAPPPRQQPATKPRKPLSLILMDIEMPIQNGLDCTRIIRGLERDGRISGGRLPIIAVSANARAEQIQEARNAGCDDVLVKPYRMPELIEKMKMVVSSLNGQG